METATLHSSIPLEPLLTPLSHFRKNSPSTPLFVSPSPSSTSPISGPSMPPLPSIVLDLSLPLPQLLTLQQCSDNSGSTPPHHSPQMASELMTKPAKHLLFCSPLPKGEGVKQALAWNREQLLDLRRLWELCCQHQISNRLIPMAHPPHMISDSALGVENRINTATAIPPLSQTPLLTSPLESQCGPPFQPTAWCDLTSVMRRPRHWQVASSTLSTKTAKMPLHFRRPTTTGSNLLTSLQRVSESPPPSLPKGWVYEVEGINVKTEAEVVNPTNYQLINTPLTRLKRKRQLEDPLDDPHRRHRRASSITEALPSFPSASATSTAVKRWRVTSMLTSTPQTLT
jgi:hypothetical protein